MPYLTHSYALYYKAVHVSIVVSCTCTVNRVTRDDCGLFTCGAGVNMRADVMCECIAVLMIRVEICPDITLSFINTIIFSLIMYSKCVRSN